MGKKKPSPRYNVVSVRFSDEDMLVLKRLLKKRRATASAVLRHALATLGRLENLAIPRSQHASEEPSVANAGP